jgi:alpha-tubulin suppressor-like RCC1 family protein
VGSLHNVVLRKDGSVVAWGFNSFGQTNVPSDLTNAIAIAAGDEHTLALRADGTVAAWGAGLEDSGAYGQYGQCLIPYGLEGVAAFAAGSWHSVALRSNGTVVIWGDYRFGQRPLPANLGSVTAIAAGDYHTLALKSDGTVVAWGFNGYGQTNVPSDLSGVIAIAAGSSHSLAIKRDGTVVAWGAGLAIGASGKYPRRGLKNLVFVEGGGYTSWAITAPLQITSFRISGTDVIIGFRTFAGQTYSIETSSTLEALDWANIEGSTVQGDGLDSFYTHTNALAESAGRAFYRLKTH